MSWGEFYKSIQEAYHIEDEATVIKIPVGNIIEISSEELVFKNSDGETEKINLDECAKNYDLVQGISPEQREGRLKCIGGRCFPFFEFFTPTHHTRFYISLKKTAFTRFLDESLIISFSIASSLSSPRESRWSCLRALSLKEAVRINSPIPTCIFIKR